MDFLQKQLTAEIFILESCCLFLQKTSSYMFDRAWKVPVIAATTVWKLTFPNI